MSDELFSFKVRAEPSGSFAHRQNTSQLGDGYSVSAADGINTERQSWSITVTGAVFRCGATEEAGEPVLALAFLRRHGQKAESFLWETPLGETIRVESGDITAKKAGRVWTIGAAFKQVYR